MQWFGTLEYLIPYDAYLLQSSAADTLIYFDDVVSNVNPNLVSFNSIHEDPLPFMNFNYKIIYFRFFL